MRNRQAGVEQEKGSGEESWAGQLLEGNIPERKLATGEPGKPGTERLNGEDSGGTECGKRVRAGRSRTDGMKEIKFRRKQERMI